MEKSEHQPEHISTLGNGANIDDEQEIVNANPATGIFADSHNAQVVSNDGSKTGSLNKRKGELLTYPNTTSLANYTCIGSKSVNEHIVEFWAPISGLGAGICRVDGVIVLNSINFDLDPNYPLQLDSDDNIDAPLVFITDNRIPPSIFNIKDMLDSLTANPTRYFAAFDPLQYQINLQSPMDIPVFIELINVGGGGGLPVGQYQYQMRYVTESGDRTNWSPATPMVPIVQSLSSESRIYPWVKAFGGPPAPSSVTAYAPKLRFRITNLYNYDYIEIKRLAYNAGAGIEFTPAGVIVAKIPISLQEISVREYIDPSESNTNIVLSANDETQELAEVESAKSIRYHDRRTVLMNVKLASKDSAVTFLTMNGKEGWPVIDRIYKEGHSDPWNHTYKRAFMHGEKYGFAANVYDGVGTKFFADRITTLANYQFPNRRDPIAPETANYSFDGTVKASTTAAASVVDQTHEVFDLSDPRSKSDNCNFKNIIHEGRVLGLTGTKTTIEVKEDCDEDEGEIENHGANVQGSKVSVSYQPYTPVRATDPDVTGHEYVTNTHVYTSADDVHCASANDKDFGYRPPGFAPDYYAQGMMIAGLTNFPKGAKSFSIVRTQAAKRVLCQGIGWYSMTQAKFKIASTIELGGKEQNKVWFYSPDIEQGIVSSDALNDIIDNPQNYDLQFVSPLGFFSEVFGFENNTIACNRDRLIDMVSYARMIRDRTSPAGSDEQINRDEDVNMGTPDADGFNYIDYDKWRNISQNPNTFGGDPDKGNRLMSIASIKRKVDGRGQYLEIEMNDNLYGKASVGGISDRHFGDSGMKDFTEPIYTINIIRRGAEVRDQNIQKYKQTTFYQKLESIIGKGTGVISQKYILVDERWEDCIPSPKSGQYGSGTNRFLYIKKVDGTYQKWINVTYMINAQKSAITSAITGAGFYQLGPDKIYGVYTHTNIGGLSRFFEINFYHATIFPALGELIIVKYDNTAPIRVFGGDTFVGEAIFAPIDRQADAKEKAAETQFAWGVGLPYYKFRLNPRVYSIRKAGALVNVIQDSLPQPFGSPLLGYLRQLCVMFTCETRAGIHYAHNSEYPNQYFPLINYVTRPNRWDEDKGLVDQGVYQDYEDDYGTQEKTQWKWGGFRFLQQINADYACEPPISFFSKPKFGFVERRVFKTRAMWSLQRAINVQDTPGLKTFAANNNFDISDNCGEIKRAWEATTDSRGENLYAITNKGICLLVTKKSILSDLTAGQLGYMAASVFIGQQYWITKDVGMYDENWRGAVEGYVPFTMEDGTEIRKEALYFPNNESVFRFMDNQVIDIGRNKYYTKIFNEGLKNILPGFGTHVTGAFDKFHQEYWLHIKGEGLNKTFVFGQKTGMWYGTCDFQFDRFTTKFTKIFGHRDMETFELNQGFTMNGSPVLFKVLVGASPEQKSDKEFIQILVNSPQDQKPTKVKFYKKIGGPIQCSLDPSNVSQGALYMKDYRGFRGFIPRLDAAVSAERHRFQQRIIFIEVEHDAASEFKIIDIATQYKKIK